LTGAPLDIAARLAQAVGAAVRCTAAGGARVIPLWPETPRRMPRARATTTYDDRALLSLEVQRQPGGEHNAVDVLGGGPRPRMPELEIERPEAGLVRGQEVFARVYWLDRPEAHGAILAWATAGQAVRLGDIAETAEEVVAVTNGAARLSRPAQRLLSVSWIGRSVPGEPVLTPGEKDVFWPEPGCGLGRVRYQTAFTRYRIDKPNIDELLFVLSAWDKPGPSARVVAGDGVAEPSPDPIHEPLLGDTAGAVARGSAWLAENFYARDVIRFSAPYREAAVPGAVIFLREGGVAASGNYLLLESVIRFQGPVILNEMEAVRCLA